MELYKVFQTTSGQDIMEKFQKAEENLEKGPNVIGFKFKGYTKTKDSNINRMKKLKQPPPEKREISDLVIQEHEDWAEDRLKHSHCILAHSTAHCGQLLEGETEPDGNVYKYADIKSNDQKPVSLIQSDSSYLSVAS